MTRRTSLPSAAFLGVVMLAACGPSDTHVANEQVAVIRTLALGREAPEGVAPGFDLDGFVSDARDDRACRQPDFIDSDGAAGVDNQFARVLPLVDLAAEGALDAFVQTAINEGRFLIFFRVIEHDDGARDLVVQRGDDVPLLGTDGLLLAGQTLALHSTPSLGAFEHLAVDGQRVTAGPFPLRFLIVVFSRLYELDLEHAMVRFDLGDDGALHRGVVGGSVTLDQIFNIIAQADELVGEDLNQLFGNGLRELADVNRDGTGQCQSLSMGVTFEAVSAFTF